MWSIDDILWAPESPSSRFIANGRSTASGSRRAAGTLIRPWDQISTLVAKNNPSNNTQLLKEVKKAWDNLPHGNLKTLIESMPRRCQAVISARGGPTRY